LKRLDLAAWVAKTGHPNHRTRTHTDSGTSRQRKEIDASGGDVLTKVARRNHETLGVEVVEQLCVQEMNLPKVWLRRIPSDTRPMLDCLPTMRVVPNATVCQQLDALYGVLGEGVLGASMNCLDPSGHIVLLPNLTHNGCESVAPKEELRETQRLRDFRASHVFTLPTIKGGDSLESPPSNRRV